MGVLVAGLERRLRPALLDSLTKRMQGKRREVLLGVHQRDALSALDHINTFRAYRTFGVLTISGLDPLTDEVVQALRAGQEECGPWVAVFFSSRRSDVPCVTLDVRGVIKDFLKRMSSAERRHVFVVGASTVAFEYCASVFRDELAAQREIQGEVLAVHGEDPERFSQQVFPKLNKKAAEGPIGVLTWEDYDAFAIATGLQREGTAVPERVAVVGYGNWEIASLCHPPLTTYDVRGILPAMADKAMELLDEVRTGKSLEPIEYSFQPKLVVRESFVPVEERR